MINKIKNLRNKEEGFTLIELLIVVGIISILAAIASPLILEAQLKEQAKSVKTDVSLNVKMTAAYLNENPYALLDSATPACETGSKATPGLYPVVSNNSVCISIVGNKDNYIIRGSSTSIEGYYQYSSQTSTYTKQGVFY